MTVFPSVFSFNADSDMPDPCNVVGAVSSWRPRSKTITQKPYYLQYYLANSLSVFLANSYILN